MKSLVPGCVAEFVGTFAFTFFGCASIMLTAPAAGSVGSLITVALAHALTISVFITGAMYISGGQFNPAVSIGLVVAGKQSPVQAAAFTVFQLLGAACAVGMLRVLLPSTIANSAEAMHGATIGSMTKAGLFGQVIGVEAILTFALMFTVLAAVVDDRAHKLGGFPIGLVIGACILAAGPLTGASMNPARSFGPAVCGNHWDMFSAYLIGPIGGAIVAALLYRVFWAKKAA